MVTEVEQQTTISNEHKAEHLQMIQSVIERMSTTSALYKGFSATIVTGVSAISFVDINPWILLLAFVPVICFFLMDVYYFRLEKKYRILYEKVRLEKVPADFSMNANCANSELLDANGSWIIDVINVKSDPLLIGSLRGQDGYFPAYHMNKEKWLSIQLGKPELDDAIKDLLSLSYELTAPKKRKPKSSAKNPGDFANGKEKEIDEG